MCDYCAWIEKILRPSRLEASPTICVNIPEKPKIPVKYDRTILVHGRADSASSREEINGILESIEKAATEAYKELAKGCESVDAVELAIFCVEKDATSTNLNDEIIDTREEKYKCAMRRDAAIMDSDSNAGSVGAVTGITGTHPITLAKRVMQKTDHILIVESGAHKLATEFSENEYSDRIASSSETTTRKKMWRMKSYGAIARDRKGRLACGVATTMNNRQDNIKEISSMSAVGTVLGCGIFADEERCCSVSGEDRAMYVYAPARKIIKRLERATKDRGSEAVSVEEELNDELTNFTKKTGESCIGVATLSRRGKPQVAFKSNFFPWAYCSNGIVTFGGVDDEIFTKEIEALDMPLDCECH